MINLLFVKCKEVVAPRNLYFNYVISFILFLCFLQFFSLKFAHSQTVSVHKDLGESAVISQASECGAPALVGYAGGFLMSTDGTYQKDSRNLYRMKVEKLGTFKNSLNQSVSNQIRI